MKVSWDDYSQNMEKTHVPNHQPVMVFLVGLPTKQPGDFPVRKL